MTRMQWAFWIVGLFASLAVLAVIGMMKGGPDWYLPVFIASVGYCVIANIVAIYLRRAVKVIPGRDGWLHAMSTARLGFLGVIALAFFLVMLIALRVGR